MDETARTEYPRSLMDIKSSRSVIKSIHLANSSRLLLYPSLFVQTQKGVGTAVDLVEDVTLKCREEVLMNEMVSVRLMPGCKTVNASKKDWKSVFATVSRTKHPEWELLGQEAGNLGEISFVHVLEANSWEGHRTSERGMHPWEIENHF